MSSEFSVDALIDRLQSYGDDVFLRSRDGEHTYADLIAAVNSWRSKLQGVDRSHGVVGLVSDYSLHGVAALLALWSMRTCVALVPGHAAGDESYANSGHLGYLLTVDEQGLTELKTLASPHRHELLDRLDTSGNPGLILFSSGSSGEPKAVLHDLHRFISKFEVPGKKMVTYAFLVFDHVAGQDTLLYTLNAGGSLVTSRSRRPLAVAELVQEFSVEVLPASPTFLHLMLASGADQQFDMRSVKIITYGSEPMGKETLARLAEACPHARIIQKYGTSEFGAVRSKSRSDTSLFIKIKQDEVQTQIRDGLLWVKSSGTMLGYLNASAAMDEDGWICTGDMVEQEGEWLRILGRASDLINVGGEKVIPAEVESILVQADNVIDAVVRGESHPLTGMIVAADVMIAPERDISESKSRRELVKEIRRHCQAHLSNYKIPVKFRFSSGAVTTDRQKKLRR